MSTTTAPHHFAEPMPADAGLIATPADPRAELAHYQAVAASIEKAERRRTTREWLLMAAVVVAVPSIVSGWYAWATNPLIQPTIEFVPIAEDGTIASAYRWEALDPRVRGDAMATTAWQYVWYRESYSATGMDQAYRRVTALSDDITRTEYMAITDPKNPGSQWARYGEKVKVELTYDSHWDLCPHTGCPDQAAGYAFRFWRTEVHEGVRRPPVMYVAQVRFRREVPGIDPRQRVTFNPGAMQVTQYVNGTPAGINTGAPR